MLQSNNRGKLQNMDFSDRQAELDAFKELNLSVVASNFGYRIVKTKSTRHSVLMESSNDKIIVGKNGKHYVYCSVFNDQSNGTIIDFAQQSIEPGASLGRVRQLLRPFLNVSFFSTVQKQHEGHFASSIRQSNTDFLAVATRYSQFEPIVHANNYLCKKRFIPLPLLRSDRIKGRVALCGKTQMVIFPHWGIDEEGDGRPLTGYELKGCGVSLFSKAGRKGLWISAGYEHDNAIVFAESGVDALSYMTLNSSSKNLRVASVSGQISSIQLKLISCAIARMPLKSSVIAAFDSDRSGDKLTEKLKGEFENCGRSDLKFVDHRPEIRSQDWNYVLSVS